MSTQPIGGLRTEANLITGDQQRDEKLLFLSELAKTCFAPRNQEQIDHNIAEVFRALSERTDNLNGLLDAIVLDEGKKNALTRLITIYKIALDKLGTNPEKKNAVGPFNIHHACFDLLRNVGETCGEPIPADKAAELKEKLVTLIEMELETVEKESGKTKTEIVAELESVLKSKEFEILGLLICQYAKNIHDRPAPVEVQVEAPKPKRCPDASVPWSELSLSWKIFRVVAPVVIVVAAFYLESLTARK